MRNVPLLSQVRAKSLLMAAVLAAGAFAGAAAPAAAAPAPATAITCNSGQVYAVGGFTVSCTIPAGTSALAAVTARGTSCASTATAIVKKRRGPRKCGVVFQVAANGLAPGATTGAAVHPDYATGVVHFLYDIASTTQPAEVDVTVSAGSGTSLTGASTVIKDDPNISDGAAKGQASD